MVFECEKFEGTFESISEKLFKLSNALNPAFNILITYFWLLVLKAAYQRGCGVTSVVSGCF